MNVSFPPKAIALIGLGMCACSGSASLTDTDPDPAVSPESIIIPRYEALTLQTFTAPEADQGVAVDDMHFYAVDNYEIAKYDRSTGAFVTRWIGEQDGDIQHLNSCYAQAGTLHCAHSNFPDTPMISSIETFSTLDLSHTASFSLGNRDEGSLTWFSPYNDEGWIAGFAHYDGRGGVLDRDSSDSSIVAFDNAWDRIGGWMLPTELTDIMAPYASSGGQIGPDGRLYLTGHDRPEMYVLAPPVIGIELVYLGVIDVETRGQAFSFDPTQSGNIFAIDRKTDTVFEIQLPTLP